MRFYIFDATRDHFDDGEGGAASLSQHISYLSLSDSHTPDSIDDIDSNNELKQAVRALSTPVFVFDSNYTFIGSFNHPDTLPSCIYGHISPDGVESRLIDIFIEEQGLKLMVTACVLYSDQVTSCGRTYPIGVELSGHQAADLKDVDFDLIEEIILQSVSEGETACFYDDFSYKLYDISPN